MMQVDNREDPKIFNILDKMKTPYSKEQLLVGDYYSSDKNIIIERKEITDFLTSYTEGRLPEQCQNMELNFDTFYLFISGKMETIWFNHKLPSHIRNIKEKTYMKMKLHLLRSFPGLKIMEFKSDTKLLEGVVELFSYEGNKRTTNIIRRKASKEDVFLSQICCVPGIGLERAKRILKTIGSTYKLFEASVENLEAIEGIGKIQAIRIKEYFSTI